MDSDALRRARAISEAELQNAVRHALVTFNFVVYHTRLSIGSDRGFPDLVAVGQPGGVQEGRVLFIELKREGGKLTQPQAFWQDALMHCPGVERYVWFPRQWQDGTIERVLRGEGGQGS